jgi:hypothetical protein
MSGELNNDGVSVLRGPGEPPVEEPAEETFDPADYNIAQVKDFVEANPDLRADVLASEEAGKNRSTLIEWLNEEDD